MKILRRIIKGNGYNLETFPWKGEELNHLQTRLSFEFKDQGDFYLMAFGLDRMRAKEAGYHPEDTNFNINCEGWKRFLIAKGVIRDEETLEEVDVSVLLWEEISKEET